MLALLAPNFITETQRTGWLLCDQKGFLFGSAVNSHHLGYTSRGQTMKGLFLLRPDAYDKIYGPQERRQIQQLVDIYAPLQTAASVEEDPSALADAL